VLFRGEVLPFNFGTFGNFGDFGNAPDPRSSVFILRFFIHREGRNGRNGMKGSLHLHVHQRSLNGLAN